MALPMTDLTWLTLCAFQEAVNQPDEGVAAIGHVGLARTELRYASDGTIAGTIERHAQFSWTEYAMVNHVYQRVAENMAEELARIEALLAQDEAMTAQWGRCTRITSAVMAKTFRGPLFDQLTDRTVLYDNLDLAHPDWADTSHFVVKIGAHSFFEPQGVRGQPIGAVSAAHTQPVAAPKSQTISMDISL